MYFKDASTSDLQRNSPQYRSLERHLRGISRTPSQFCKLQVTDKHYKSLSMQMYRIFVFYGIFNIFSTFFSFIFCTDSSGCCLSGGQETDTETDIFICYPLFTVLSRKWWMIIMIAPLCHAMISADLRCRCLRDHFIFNFNFISICCCSPHPAVNDWVRLLLAFPICICAQLTTDN